MTVLKSLDALRASAVEFLSDLNVESAKRSLTSLSRLFYEYLTSLELDDDGTWSIKLGVAIGVVIVGTLVLFPGEPFDYSKIDGGAGDKLEVTARCGEGEESSSKKSKSGEDSGDKRGETKKGGEGGDDNDGGRMEEDEGAKKEPLSLDLSTEEIMARTSKVQKVFGLSDSQMALAVENAKKESRGVKISENDVSFGSDGFSASQKVDMIVYAGLFAALIYFANRDFGADAGRWFYTYFPREAKALGIWDDTAEVITRMKTHQA